MQLASIVLASMLTELASFLTREEMSPRVRRLYEWSKQLDCCEVFRMESAFMGTYKLKLSAS